MASDDPGDRKHVEAPNDAGPFDHGCGCDVCKDYREEVRDVVFRGRDTPLTDAQERDAHRIVRKHLGSQQRLTDVQGTED